MSDIPGGPTPPPPPPPPGTPPGPGALRPRTLGEILSAAFEIYKANAAKLFVVVAVVVVPLSLIGALVSEAVASGSEETITVFGETQTISDRTFAAIVAGSIIAALVAVIISAVLQAAMMRAAALATIGDPVDVENSYRWGFKRFGSVILVALLVGIVIAVGFILLIIPGIIFLTLLSVSIPALVIENRRGTDAMKRSWDLASGNFWHVLGVIIVAALITACGEQYHRVDRREQLVRPLDLHGDRPDRHGALLGAGERAALPGPAGTQGGSHGRLAACGARRERLSPTSQPEAATAAARSAAAAARGSCPS